MFEAGLKSRVSLGNHSEEFDAESGSLVDNDGVIRVEDVIVGKILQFLAHEGLGVVYLDEVEVH